MGCTTSSNSARTAAEQADLETKNVTNGSTNNATISANDNNNNNNNNNGDNNTDNDKNQKLSDTTTNGVRLIEDDKKSGNDDAKHQRKLSIQSSSSASTSASSSSSFFSSTFSATLSAENGKSKSKRKKKSGKNKQDDKSNDTLNPPTPSTNDIIKGNGVAEENVGQNDKEETKKMADEEVDIDLNDPEVGKAAVKIQAGFKNYMARKKDPKEEEDPKAGGSTEASEAEKERKEVEDGIAEIDLNDPEMEKAATKIQATFRGYKTRKEPTIEAK